MALQGSMLDRPARQGTDVNNDPNYWRALLTSPNRQIREQAEMMMRILETRNLREDQQIFQGQNLAESRAQRSDYNNARLDQRRSEQADRLDMAEARKSAVAEANATRRAQQLQFMAADPNLSPDIRNAAKAAMVKDLGLDTGTAPAAGGPKGEYGPGGFHNTTPDEIMASARGATQSGAPHLPAKPTTSTYTPPTMSFTTGGGGFPDRPNPTTSYNPNRYSPKKGFTPQERTRIKGNLDRVDAEDARFNELAFKRDVGGERYASVYGTSDPALIKPGMAPAADIPGLYPGKSTIPQGARVGYYDKDGNFVAPAYDQSGQKLPMPKGKGVTGLVGTAGLGLNYDANSGNVVNPGAAGKVIAGEADQGAYKPPTAAFTDGQPVATPQTAPAQGQGFLSKALPALEFGMLPALGPYAPAAAAFLGHQGTQPRAAGTQEAAPTAPTPPPIAGGPQANPTPQGVQPSVFGITKFENAPTPTPAGTPPAIPFPTATPANVGVGPLSRPLAQNDRADLLRDAENTFYGGGTAPVPTPTPTPPQRVVQAQPPQIDQNQLLLAYLRQLGLA